MEPDLEYFRSEKIRTNNNRQARQRLINPLGGGLMDNLKIYAIIHSSKDCGQAIEKLIKKVNKKNNKVKEKQNEKHLKNH